MRRGARYLTLLGPFVVVAALSKVHAAYVADPPYDYTDSFRLLWSIAYAVLLALAAYGAGLPELPRSARAALLPAGMASAAAAVAMSVVQLATGDGLLPRFVVFGAAALCVPLQMAATSAARWGRHRDEGRDRVIMVGSAEEAATLERDLAMAPERPAVLSSLLATGDAEGDGSTVRPLIDAALADQASVVVLDRNALANEQIIAQAAALHEAGLRVRSLLQFYEEWLAKLPVSELERASLFFDISEVHRAQYARVKRLTDLVGAAVGMVVLVLAVPFVVVANLLGNRGPLVYRQPRVGRDGQVFQILKFRTMRPTDPGKASTDWTTADDPRITPFGRLLRTTHLDELPQVINIWRGDLSLVGPRPEQERYVTELSAQLPFYGMRHLVRPGLTGWAQVKYGYAGDERDALEKLQYEFFYLRHQGLRFDLRVLARTVRSVAGSEGGGR